MTPYLFKCRITIEVLYMDIRVLKYFLEMARESSMTRAAEKLCVSQPTMSKQLKDLEKITRS